MYGVPPNLNLSRFKEATLTQLCIGEYQIQFHFTGVQEPHSMEIGVEGKWELRDSVGAVVDSGDSATGPYSKHRTLQLQILLGQRVAGSAISPPSSISLNFSSGHTLIFFDSSNKYESFTIQPGDIVV